MSETVQHPVVRLRDGIVRGRVEAGVISFLGIPYAAPPFGRTGCARRSPSRPGRASATPPRTGRPCPRATTRRSTSRCPPEPVIPGEDCLNLNVWTPDPRRARAARARLDPRRLVHERLGRRSRAYDGAGLRPRRRGLRDHQLPAGRRGLPAHSATAPPTSVCSTSSRPCEWVQRQHRRVRRRPGEGDRRRRVRRGDERDHAAVDAAAAGLFGRPSRRAAPAAHTLDRGRPRPKVTALLAEQLGVAPTRDGDRGRSRPSKLVRAAREADQRGADRARPGASGASSR